MHLFLSGTADSEPLCDELRRTFPGSAVEERAPGLVLARGFTSGPDPLPPLVFARQFLPDARFHAAASIRGWADLLFEAIARSLPDDAPWRLHVFPHFGRAGAGEHRCRLVVEALDERLRERRRALRRRRETGTDPVTASHSLVQLVLTGPDQGFLSIAPAPVPFAQRHLLSPFPRGEIPVAGDPTAPSRAFAKLLEAELRLGRAVGPGETCVDLGACPGSWSYVALNRGATVTAVDRAPLREDLMEHPRLRFVRGDAFTFRPATPVDWLLCDVIAAPERSIGLLLDWLRDGWCRRFAVTIKFKGTGDYPQLDRLKAELPPLCDTFLLTRLCANKNEACAAGERRRAAPQG